MLRLWGVPIFLVCYYTKRQNQQEFFHFSHFPQFAPQKILQTDIPVF